MALFKLLICLAAFVLLAVPSAQGQACGPVPAPCPGGDSGTLYCASGATSWIQNCGMTLAPVPPTPSPTTRAPTTAPTTAAPTPAPTTAAPTPAPTTAAPTTAAPTPAPTTAAPTTQAPTTQAPTTQAPTTQAPTTAAPTTAAPTTIPPTTAAVTTAPATTRPNTTAPVTTTPAATTKLPLCPSKPDGCTCDGNTPVAPKGGWPSCKDRAWGVCRPVCRPKSSDPCQCEWANSCEAAPACSASKRKACIDMCSSQQKSTFEQGSRCLGKPPGKSDSNPDWQCSWSEAECDCKWSPVCPAVPPTCLSLPTSGDGCSYLKACMNVRCPDSCTLTLSHLQDGFCNCPFSQAGKTWADKIKMCVADKMLKELQGVDSGVSSYNSSSDFCSSTNAPTKASSLLPSNYGAKGYCSQSEAYNGPFYISCEDARQSFGRYYQECSNSTNSSSCDLSCADRNAMLTNVATGNYSASDLRIFRNMLTSCGKEKYSEMKMEFRSPGRVVMQKRKDVYNKISQILNISTDYCTMFSDDSDSSNDSSGVYAVYIVIFGDSKVNASQATTTLSQPGNQAQLAAVVGSTLLRASDCIGPCPLTPAVIGPLSDDNNTSTNNQTQAGNNTLTPFQNQTSPAPALLGPGPGALALLALLLIVGAYEVLLH